MTQKGHFYSRCGFAFYLRQVYWVGAGEVSHRILTGASAVFGPLLLQISVPPIRLFLEHHCYLQAAQAHVMGKKYYFSDAF